MNATDKLQRVKALLRNIFADTDRYQQMLVLLEQQRITMIRRQSDALIELNETLMSHCQALSASADERRELLQALGLRADKSGIDAMCGWLPACRTENGDPGKVACAGASGKTLSRL